MQRFVALFGRPEVLRNFHGIMTLIWFVLIFPSVLWWKESVTWIVIMSVWANLVGHFSSWQAARVEVVQQEQIEGQK
jgi:hypothetical protein